MRPSRITSKAYRLRGPIAEARGSFGTVLMLSSRSYAASDANIAASERSMASQLFHTDAIGATVSEADTTARRFVLTRRTAERKAFDEGKQRYPDQLVRLRGQFAGQTEAVPHLLTLAESVATHFTVLEEVIERASAKLRFAGQLRVAKPVNIVIAGHTRAKLLGNAGGN